MASSKVSWNPENKSDSGEEETALHYAPMRDAWAQMRLLLPHICKIKVTEQTLKGNNYICDLYNEKRVFSL